MSNERLMKVLLGPLMSEKSANAADNARQFTFKVTTDATKPEIAAAVEQLFDVTVDKVQTIKVKGKSKRFGQIQGKRKDWKKAIVRLAEGQDIDFGAGA
ncbi:50S ribosomal protein L23 [Thiolapillus brandeum]|uniref:Large ribosomal subunit protein uL23 n=1 Tax=Thiolapillus brandeum TaxID=1076588 RepID=A0A7U6GGJ9_9GAMM|nr:50S ribosomal protein L23 [Thiolapillus brandeum]BAO43248.1 large subunit ribosomal protein L23 [Thiolapillus brandeum]